MASGGGGAGGKVLSLLVLLAILGGAGFWNYQRNVAKEDARPRPYKGYSDSDLRAMTDAYQQEVDQYSKSWKRSNAQRADSADHRLVGDAAREFDRVQSKTSQTRALKRELADRQVVLEELQEELSYRGGLASGWQLHLQRLTTFD